MLLLRRQAIATMPNLVGMTQQLLKSLNREAKRRALLLAAKLWILLHPRAAGRIRAEKSWIFGAALGTAYVDNSAALFEHVRRARPEVNANWVINPNSPDLEKARAHGKVLFSGEVMTYVRALLAAVHVISHGIHDVPGCASRLSSQAVKVRLGHGLTALKRTKPRRGLDLRSSNAPFDLVPVASEFEKNHKLDWEIDPSRMIVTGLARFDKLVRSSRRLAAEPRTILYMPTWRDDEDADALRSGIGDFLTDPALGRLLDDQNARLEVFLHPNLNRAFRNETAGMSGDRIRFSDVTDPQELLAGAGLLITDYSSVAWDMLYIDKPVVFYQFDPERFEEMRGGYLMPDEFPGPLARNPTALFERIEEFLAGAWRQNVEWLSQMKEAQEKVFAFRDSGNCERITIEIERCLGARS